MDSEKPKGRPSRGLTVAALLGLFVIAALAALGIRLLPGGASGLARRLFPRERDDREG